MASTEQWENAQKHGTMVENANGQLDVQKQAVAILKNTLNSTGIRDNQVNLKLQNLQDDSKKCKFVSCTKYLWVFVQIIA